jgi:hypothetical protein
VRQAMSATQAAPVSAPQTPSDGEPAPVPKQARKRNAPRRFQLFDDGQGDFRICEIIPPGHKSLPPGALIPLSEFGGFPDAVTAKKALRTKGDTLQGKQVLVIRGVEIVRVMVESRPSIKIESKPRKQISGPVTG